MDPERRCPMQCRKFHGPYYKLDFIPLDQYLDEDAREHWIIKHDLVEVKELFAKHNATTITALKLTSTEFKSLMTDPTLFSKAHTIPKIMDAMQSMSLSI